MRYGANGVPLQEQSTPSRTTEDSNHVLQRQISSLDLKLSQVASSLDKRLRQVEEDNKKILRKLEDISERGICIENSLEKLHQKLSEVEEKLPKKRAPRRTTKTKQNEVK